MTEITCLVCGLEVLHLVPFHAEASGFDRPQIPAHIQPEHVRLPIEKFDRSVVGIASCA